MKLLDIIDDFLNEITMYRLLVYGLSLLAILGLTFSLLGMLAISTSGLLLSLGLLLVTCYAANKLLAKAWQAVPNQESWLITALILLLILPPATTLAKAIGVAAVGLIAMAAKYMLAVRHKHLFNPAAVAAVIAGWLGLVHASWWVGNSTLWPYSLVLGLLVVKKIRRFSLLSSFVLSSLVVTVVISLANDQNLQNLVKPVLLASPLIFLGTIMLTEPATMPPRRLQQMVFGSLVGALYSLHLQLPGVYVYPETALVIGNIYAFLMAPKHKWNLQLKEVQVLSDRVRNYVFVPEQPIVFRPGQYMDWTLPGVKFDSRGNRRTFTIASSPTEETVMLGSKFYQPSSAYKQALLTLQPGDRIVAGQLAGNFCLPKDHQQKLAFIAGGIGITPFRSMLKYLEDTKEKRDIVLFYLISDPHEVSYMGVLQAAASQGIRIMPVLTSAQPAAEWKGITGQLDANLLTRYAPDIAERRVYISGPNIMVTKTRRLVRSLGVTRRNIVTDYFSGY